MVHAVDVRQTGFGAHFVAAGQPCTGAPDFRATEHAAWDHTSPRVAQPPPCCSHSAALCTHRRLRPAPRRRPIKPLPWERSRSIPTMHRQSELPQKLLSRLIKLRRGYADGYVSFYSAEDEGRQEACRLSAHLLNPHREPLNRPAIRPSFGNWQG